MLLWWLLGAVALCVGLLFIPIEFAVSARLRRGVRVRGRWLFGLVRFQSGGSSAASPASTAAARSKKRVSKPFSSRRALRVGRRILAIDDLVPRTLRLFRDLARSVRWRRGFVSLRVGLGDPADTGELCGWVWGAMACLPASWIRFDFEPEFDEACFEADAGAVCRITPARVVGSFLRFLVSRPARQAMGVMVWARTG